MGNVPPMEKFAITVIEKTEIEIETEQTEIESPADKGKFFLDAINPQRNPENLVTISQIKN